MDRRFGSEMPSSSYAPHPTTFTHIDNDAQDTQLPSNGYYGHDEPRRPLGEDVASQGLSLSSHNDYPAAKPFINDHGYRRDLSKPEKTFPENNREAVMDALKSLQEKMRQLELERAQAEDNLKVLASDTMRYRDILHREPELVREEDHTDLDVNISATLPPSEARPYDRPYDRGYPGLHNSRLESTEQRCKLLEKQLESMRNMVQNAEYDRTNAMRQSHILQQQRDEIEQEELRDQLHKIGDLEREHLKLTATQSLAEHKIRDLEEKLKEERHYRKMMNSKASELETAAQAQRILRDAVGVSTAPPRPKTGKKKKKKVVSTVTRPTTSRARKMKSCTNKKPGREAVDHYRLNLAEIPFISGQSATPSHSLAANFQEVLSLMKNHNTKLCRSPRNHSHTSGLHYFKNRPTSGTSATSTTNCSDVTDLLVQLQDEFGTMTMEHQELIDQIRSATDVRLQEDLERELDGLVARMEAKGDQISRLRRHQDTLSSKTRRSQKSGLTSTVEIPCRDTDSQSNGRVEVCTTIRTKGNTHTTHRATSPHGTTHTTLNLYRGLKKIQSSLRKDDLSWD